MVRKLAFIAAAVVMLGACQVDANRMIDAGSDAYKAETLTDQEVRDMSAQFVVYEDGQNKVAAANSKYTKRLNNIAKKFPSIDGVPLNFKVYVKDEINAFATADGSIRVYSGLMDKMTDDELLFVLGHEIGHVAKGHSKGRMKTAYRVSALGKAAGAAHSAAAALTDSQLGALAQEFLKAQYSQANELEADKYGAELLKKNGKSVQIAIDALNKLGGGESSVMSSHPSSSERMNKLKSMV